MKDLNNQKSFVRQPPLKRDDTLIQSFSNEKGVGYIDTWYDKDANLASIGQYKKNGSYLRTEINSDYYRNLQQKYLTEFLRDLADGKRIIKKHYKPHPSSWKLFIKTLDLFEKKNIKLIVNVLEEANFTYLSEADRASYVNFMNGPVRQAVEQRNYRFIYLNFEKISDEYYFDYNHLNRRGVEKFTSLLEPHLRQIKKNYLGKRRNH
jgi:hypothetical protein